MEDTLSEAVWIRKAQMGDERAFRRLVEQYAGVVWTVINRMTGDRALAEDLFQETVVKFWKGLPSFQGDSKLSTWLYKIAYRVCLDGLKRVGASRSESLEARLELTGEEPESEQHDGRKLESDVAARGAVGQALEKLQPEWRTMITLFYWQGQSVEEIAEISGRPVNTVKVYLHRARAALRSELARAGYPDGE